MWFLVGLLVVNVGHARTLNNYIKLKPWRPKGVTCGAVSMVFWGTALHLLTHRLLMTHHLEWRSPLTNHHSPWCRWKRSWERGGEGENYINGQMTVPLCQWPLTRWSTPWRAPGGTSSPGWSRFPPRRDPRGGGPRGGGPRSRHNRSQGAGVPDQPQGRTGQGPSGPGGAVVPGGRRSKDIPHKLTNNTYLNSQPQHLDTISCSRQFTGKTPHRKQMFCLLIILDWADLLEEQLLIFVYIILCEYIYINFTAGQKFNPRLVLLIFISMTKSGKSLRLSEEEKILQAIPWVLRLTLMQVWSLPQNFPLTLPWPVPLSLPSENFSGGFKLALR